MVGFSVFFCKYFHYVIFVVDIELFATENSFFLVGITCKVA